MGLLPGGGAHVLGDLGGPAEEAAEQAGGGLEASGHPGRGEGVELGAKAGAAAVADELELEALVRALVVVVAGELDLLIAHRRWALLASSRLRGGAGGRHVRPGGGPGRVGLAGFEPATS